MRRIDSALEWGLKILPLSAIDNGLRRANSPQRQPDLGHRLENAVALHLRRNTRELYYAAERDLWECDFVTAEAAVQVCQLPPGVITR